MQSCSVLVHPFTSSSSRSCSSHSFQLLLWQKRLVLGFLHCCIAALYLFEWRPFWVSWALKLLVNCCDTGRIVCMWGCIIAVSNVGSHILELMDKSQVVFLKFSARAGLWWLRWSEEENRGRGAAVWSHNILQGQICQAGVVLLKTKRLSLQRNNFASLVLSKK